MDNASITARAKTGWGRARSWLVLMVALVSGLALFWIIVPGEAVKVWMMYFDGPTECGSCVDWVDYEHGWPCVYLSRRGGENDRWSFTKEVVEFSPWTLVVDIVAAMGIVACLAGGTFVCLQCAKPTWQFRLSSVFVIFLVAALMLGGWRTLEAGRRREQALIRKIESLEGTVETDFMGPVWLRKLVGRESLRCMHRVVDVTLPSDYFWREAGVEDGRDPNPIPAIIRQLPSFTYCRTLDLSPAMITDDDLAILGSMHKLQVLDLAECSITDRGLRHLKTLSSLTQLQLAATKISDAGLRSVSLLKGLEGLNVAGTNITDRGLEEIAKLPQLQSLSIGQTKVTDAGLRHLFRLAELQDINVWDTGVTETGVKELERAIPGVSVED